MEAGMRGVESPRKGFAVEVERPGWSSVALVRPVCQGCGWQGPLCGGWTSWGAEAARHGRGCVASLWGLA